ncbi:MAG: condensation domain-containing protein, partial [Sphingobium sp.]
MTVTAERDAGRAPLTEAQSGLWYAQRLDPGNPIFNTGQYLDLRGPLDLVAFRAAVDRVGEEAEALSLRFAETAEGPAQWVDPALRPRLSVHDFSWVDDPERMALDAIAGDMATPVDPREGPMAAQTLYRLSGDRHLWSQRVHHLATDGYGMVLLTSRVAELYAAILAGKEGRGRPFAPISGVWAEDTAYRADPRRAEDAAWWRAVMADVGDVAGMAPGRAVSAHGFHRHEQPMPENVRAGLMALSARVKHSWPDVLTALVAAYCRRFIGTAEIVVGVPHMGRMGSASARVPAMMMN